MSSLPVELPARGVGDRGAALRDRRAGWTADALAPALPALATRTIGGLVARTLLGLARGELRTPSG